MESVLEKTCENIVDVIHETFMRKYYLVRISQSKREHIYLIVRKKEISCCMRKKKIFDVVVNVFSWYCKRHRLLEKKIFFLIKN